MKIVGKIFLVIIITLFGAVVTCGSNLMLYSNSIDENFLIMLWYIEIVGIFIGSLWYVLKIKKQAIDKSNSEN